jgi:hypothetical protein
MPVPVSDQQPALCQQSSALFPHGGQLPQDLNEEVLQLAHLAVKGLKALALGLPPPRQCRALTHV